MSVLMILAMLHATPSVVGTRISRVGDEILKADVVGNNTETAEWWPEGSVIMSSQFSVATSCSCFVDFSVKPENFLKIIPSFEGGMAEVVPDKGTLDVHIKQPCTPAQDVQGKCEERWFENIQDEWLIQEWSKEAKRLTYTAKASSLEGLELFCDYALTSAGSDACSVEYTATIVKATFVQGTLLKAAGPFLANAQKDLNNTMVDIMAGYTCE